MQRRWTRRVRHVEAASARQPSSPASLHAALREATRREQRSVDRLLSTLDLAIIEDYRTFLCIHHAALGGLSNKWREADRPDFEGLLECLRSDLLTLDHPVEHIVTTPHAMALSLRTWGIGYVIRASRSGCRLRRGQVPAGFAASYLNYTPQIAWPQFLVQLEQGARAYQPHGLEQIVRGARTALSGFTAAANNYLAERKPGSIRDDSAELISRDS